MTFSNDNHALSIIPSLAITDVGIVTFLAISIYVMSILKVPRGLDCKWTGSGPEVDRKWTGSGSEVGWTWAGSGLECFAINKEESI